MNSNQDQGERIGRIIAAFQGERPHPFQVRREADVFTYRGKIGVRGQNRTACIDRTRRKMAYYVEGDPYEMGYLLGRMAEPEVERMCTEFNERIIFEFIDANFRNHRLGEILGESLEIVLYWLSGNIYPDVPDEYRRELEGVLAGCREANPGTKVDWQGLWVLNVGIDAMLSYVYTGNVPIRRELPFKITHEHLTIPVQCNAFSVFGPAVEGGGHFLGRDFMFPTAGVFQDTACLIVQNPDGKQPFVSMTAPGMIGCAAGMNIRGLGVGVDMSPSGNCDPSRPGFNSLLLARHSIENGRNCDEAVDIMEEAQRGVSWDYVLAHYEDDERQRSCIVEAGCKVDDADFAAQVSRHLRDCLSDPSYDYLPRQLIAGLPDRSFLETRRSPEFRKGLMVRWNDYVYPEEYLEFNPLLFRLFRKEYNPDDFGERGYIDESWKDRNVPYGYYFAPQREHDSHLLVVTNMYIIPEMRLFAMHPWTNLIASSHYDDIQWRYDELNNQLLARLYPEPDGELTPLSLEDAKDIIDFLTPNPDKGKYPDYYNPEPEGPCWRRLWDRLRDEFRRYRNSGSGRSDWKSIPVDGSVSLMDLKGKTIHSHYGYHGDDWVQIALPNYVRTG